MFLKLIKMFIFKDNEYGYLIWVFQILMFLFSSHLYNIPHLIRDYNYHSEKGKKIPAQKRKRTF